MTAAARRRRAAIEAQVEELIALLDHIDGDCDTEDGADLENDGYDEREGDTSDHEPNIGWTNAGQYGPNTCDDEWEMDEADDGIADEDALHEVREQLAVYQHFQAKGDREHQQAVCEAIASEARSRARANKRDDGVGQLVQPAFAEPFTFGMSISTRMGGRP